MSAKTNLAVENIRDVLQYYQRTVGHGHTFTMLQGAQNVNRVTILATSHGHAKILNDMAPQADVVTLGPRLGSKLAGRTGPLVVDNDTLCLMLSAAIKEIDRLTLGRSS